MLDDYGDPQFSGIDRELTPIVGQCLYVVAQGLLMWTSLLGRQPGKPFKFGKISRANSELNQALFGMSDEQRNVALHHALELGLKQLAGLMPFTFSRLDEEVTQEHIISRIREYAAVAAPLLDGLDKHQPGQPLPSSIWRHALEAIEAGELPDVLKPAARQGRSKQPYTDWQFRYELYRMRRHLRSAGMSPGVIDELYLRANVAGWDTAKRWKKAAKRHLSAWTREDIKRQLREKAEAGLFANPEVAERTFLEVGQRYMALRRGTTESGEEERVAL